MAGDRKAPPLPDPENGIWQGRSVARRFVSPDGLTVLVGRTAEDNDVLTFKLGSPRDFWLHVAADSGSHVVVRNPGGMDRLPRETEQLAAALAAGYSKARKGGRVAVHLCRCEDVSKPRGFPPGKVLLDRYRSVQASPWRPDLETGQLQLLRERPAPAPPELQIVRTRLEAIQTLLQGIQTLLETAPTEV